MKTTRVKMCGMKEFKHVQTAISHGVSYIGYIVDYPKSKRSVSPAEIKKIISKAKHKKLSTAVKFVGVFVDYKESDVVRIMKETGLHIVQLHGKETPAYARRLRKKIKLPVWKYVEIRTMKDVRSLKQFAGSVDKIVVDRGKGSGKAIDEKILQVVTAMGVNGIAGGIKINNVQKYIRTFCPEIIDVSSGIEKSKGKKSVELIKNFMKEVKKAYA